MAWLIPGAGHVYIKRTLRGVIICLCLNGLFWTGVAIGGVFTVDPLKDRWWFSAQMCTGVSGVASWYRQEKERGKITNNFDDPKLRTSNPPLQMDRKDQLPQRWWEAYTEAKVKNGTNLAYPADTVAKAYSGVAGMLNLMCIFDAVILAAMGKFGEPKDDGRKEKKRMIFQPSDPILLGMGLFSKPILLGMGHIWLVIPLCMTLAIVYKTVRVRRLRQLPLQILSLWAYILTGLTALAVAFWILLEYAAA